MIIVSGLSGAGKSVALHTLEDLGYYCIDNLPGGLLSALYKEQLSIQQPLAVGIDIRSQVGHLQNIPEMIEACKSSTIEPRILFLTANTDVLIKRFSESRRKHPLDAADKTLYEAINEETRLLSPLIEIADYKIDTSTLSVYDLKDRIAVWLQLNHNEKTTLTIESFGFKNGIPIDADLLFDVRFLPNPHWEADIRQFTGKDKQIADYLHKFIETRAFIEDTVNYLQKWLPTYLTGYRSYLTIAIGCTGGKHRSVYVAKTIAAQLRQTFGEINIRHRDLP